MKNYIENAYRKSGNTMGWRLLSSPENTIFRAKIAFIGLNPGGSAVDARQSVYAMPEGQSAYVNESWGGRTAGQSPLQVQVQALFARLNVEPHKVLAGNLVPFRSPDWASLHNPKGSLKFGRKLWGNILKSSSASVVITMSGETTKSVADLLGAHEMVQYPVGWGKITATRGRFDGGVLIGLPHLSRFGIMNRAASAAYLDRLFEKL